MIDISSDGSGVTPHLVLAVVGHASALSCVRPLCELILNKKLRRATLNRTIQGGSVSGDSSRLFCFVQSIQSKIFWLGFLGGTTAKPWNEPYFDWSTSHDADILQMAVSSHPVVAVYGTLRKTARTSHDATVLEHCRTSRQCRHSRTVTRAVSHQQLKRVDTHIGRESEGCLCSHVARIRYDSEDVFQHAKGGPFA